MKTFIIGATGMAGEAIVAEAVKNGIKVVANGRNVEKLTQLKEKYPAISILEKDAFSLTADDFAGMDVIVDAFSTSPVQAYRHVDLATKLVAMFRNQKTRIAFILGAGSLYADQSKERLVYDNIRSDDSTKAWRATPENQLYELEFLRNVHNVNWFGISPAISFVPGQKSESILTGTDFALRNDNGASETTSGTMGYAMVQELLHQRHEQERFTVANGWLVIKYKSKKGPE